MDPSIRYAGQDHLIWDVEVDDEIERDALLSRANQGDLAIPAGKARERPTGDVHRGVFLGPRSEESRLISNARQTNRHIFSTNDYIAMRTLLRRASSLLDTIFNMTSSGSKLPFATISSAMSPMSVLQSLSELVCG